MKHYFILTALFCVHILALPAQNADPCGIYIWDFKMNSGQENSLTRDVTDTYQSLLTNQWSDALIVERRIPATIIEQQQNEITFVNGRPQIPETLSAEFKKIGASVVVLGEIKQDQGQGLFSVNIKFINIFTTQILANPLQSLVEKEFNNKPLRDKFLASIIPVTSSRIIPCKSSSPPEKPVLKVIENNKLVNSEAWKYLQTVYFEDFSNWQSRQDFRKDIWNKVTEQGKQNCLIDDGRYKIMIEKQGFVKHKYLEDKSLANNTDFSKAHPVSITVHFDNKPTCHATNGCMGRGITIRFDKKKNSGYAYTLTDDGDLKFFRFNNIHQPSDMTPLFSKTIKISPGKDYELGIIAIDSNFYLYVDRKFEKMVTDNTFTSGLNGVIAIGTGTHWFDNISVYQMVEVK